jgi:hypothetical protein
MMEIRRKYGKPRTYESSWIRIELIDELEAESSAEAKLLRVVAGSVVDSGLRVRVHNPEGGNEYPEEYRGHAFYSNDANRWEIFGCVCGICCAKFCRDGCGPQSSTTFQQYGNKVLDIRYQLHGITSLTGFDCSIYNDVTFGPVSAECTLYAEDTCITDWLAGQGHVLVDPLDDPIGCGRIFQIRSFPGGSAVSAIRKTVDGAWILYAKSPGFTLDKYAVGYTVLETNRKPLCGGLDETISLGHFCGSGDPTVCGLPTSITVMGTWRAVP